jgi:hypothetical protein
MGASRKRRPSAGLADLRWAFRADHEHILEALASGRHRRGLREYFGAAIYARLSALARRARAGAGGKSRTARKVLIIPGMMGSRLAAAGAATGAAAPVVWIDPERIAAGELARLVRSTRRGVEPRGALLHAYAQLYLTLRIRGFVPEFFAYDWRLGLTELGAQLAACLRAADAPALVIAHSMGGLVARSALAQRPAPPLERLILIGTPHAGCVDPVLALRGTHPFVRSLARLDEQHSARWLARHVFSSFPGLYDLLPEPGARGLDLSSPAAWPRTGPQPDPALLARARKERARLAAPVACMVQIIGVGEPTLDAVRPGAGGFAYRITRRGDGTVPVASARLRGVKSYFVRAAHGAMLRQPRVIAGLVDLLEAGRTDRLAGRLSEALPRSGPARWLGTDDARLEATEAAKIEWQALTPAERAPLLEQLDGIPRGRRTASRRRG